MMDLATVKLILREILSSPRFVQKVIDRYNEKNTFPKGTAGFQMTSLKFKLQNY